jgi:hypothetical protein
VSLVTKNELAIDLAKRTFLVYRKALKVAAKSGLIPADHPVLLDEILRSKGGLDEADAARSFYVAELKTALDGRKGN